MNKKVQIFMLHFAGGSSYSFDFLKGYISSEVEFTPLELPGRGKRMDEELLTNKHKAVLDYVNQIKQKRNHMPYIIYGHSMGATLGLNVAKHMEDFGDSPCHLIVSGNPGPGVKKTEKEIKKGKRYLMNDRDFKDELRELGGVPEEVLQHDELYDFFGPIMRADFQVLETDQTLVKDVPIRTPIYAIMGSEEQKHVEIGNWEKFTSSVFESKILEGDHFFIYKYPNKLIEIFMSCYEKQFQL